MRSSSRLSNYLWWAFILVVFALMGTFAFTDTWPYMHEVLWQQSWHPVCPLPNGGLEFCKP